MTIKKYSQGKVLRDDDDIDVIDEKDVPEKASESATTADDQA